MRVRPRISLLVAGLLAAGGLPAAAAAQTVLAPTLLSGLEGKEAVADRVWTLRAGLNVAALQCQFSRFLRAAPIYNALLRQHSGEFTDSFKTLTSYFKRLEKGKAGDRAFDSYATRTSQSWSTFDAQLQFCDAAATVARKALRVPKGKLAEFASLELPVLRESLIVQPPHTPEALLPQPMAEMRVPNFGKCKRNGTCKWQ